MRRTILNITAAILTFLVGTCADAQNADALARIDSTVAQLIATTDHNQYSYDFGTWCQTTPAVLDAIPDSIIADFEPQTLKKIDSGTMPVFGFVRRSANTATFCWLAFRQMEDGRKTFVFNDSFSLPNGQAVGPGVQLCTDSTLTGIAIVDSVSGARLFCVPDIDMRIDLEILADINAADAEKDSAAQAIDQKLRHIVGLPDALTMPLDGLPGLYSVSDEKQTIRLITYMVSYSDFSSKCFGLAMKKRPNGTIGTEFFTDRTDDIRSPERIRLSAKKWYGAVYNSLIEITIDKQTYYTLLGYKSNDGLVKTRVIDILQLRNGKCSFGAPVFQHPKATYHRRVFHYSAGVNMMIRYDNKLKMIVFDHLSPSNTMFTGEFRFYGPDFSYDGYSREKKGWIFKDDIDVRND